MLVFQRSLLHHSIYIDIDGEIEGIEWRSNNEVGREKEKRECG